MKFIVLTILRITARINIACAEWMVLHGYGKLKLIKENDDDIHEQGTADD